MKKSVILIVSALCLIFLVSCDRLDSKNQSSNVMNQTPIILDDRKTDTSTDTPRIEDIEIKINEITGTWQANNMVAAGFCDTYVFNEDGTFYFLANQMLYHQTKNMKGTWSLDGDNIVLKVTDKLIVKDFDVKNEGSFHPDAYEYETEKIHLEETETVIFPVTKPQEDTEVPHYSPTITINGQKFWNFIGDVDLTKEVVGVFDDKINDGVIYLDINKDGEKEKTEYLAEQNILRISGNTNLLIEVDLYDFGYDFNGIGMHSALYYYEYVYGPDHKVFLHLYRTSFIGDRDGKRYTSAFEGYYEACNNQLSLMDSVQYTWVQDSSGIESKENILINGKPALSLESIASAYTAIEHTYREIPY